MRGRARKVETVTAPDLAIQARQWLRELHSEPEVEPIERAEVPEAPTPLPSRDE